MRSLRVILIFNCREERESLIDKKTGNKQEIQKNIRKP